MSAGHCVILWRKEFEIHLWGTIYTAWPRPRGGPGGKQCGHLQLRLCRMNPQNSHEWLTGFIKKNEVTQATSEEEIFHTKRKVVCCAVVWRVVWGEPPCFSNGNTPDYSRFRTELLSASDTSYENERGREGLQWTHVDWRARTHTIWGNHYRRGWKKIETATDWIP